MIFTIIPFLLVMIFVGGYAWAGRFCKGSVSRFFMGILLGLGILFVLGGVAFAGCALIFMNSGPMR